MVIKQIQLSDLKPYENNPRIIDTAIDKVAQSIKEFGFQVPIIIDCENVIVAGHTRYEASKLLELKTVPVIIADDLTSDQVQAFRLADNKVAEYSSWDNEKLAIELQDFNLEHFDIFEETQISFMSDNEEINLDDFTDNSFDSKCPNCDFVFDKP